MRLASFTNCADSPAVTPASAIAFVSFAPRRARLRCPALPGEMDVRLPAVVGVGNAFDQSSTLHPLERPRHGRLFDGELLDQ